MWRFNDRAAQLRDTGRAGINVGDSNKSLPPRRSRPGVVGGWVHHAPNIFAIVLEYRVEPKWSSIDLAKRNFQEAPWTSVTKYLESNPQAQRRSTRQH